MSFLARKLEINQLEHCSTSEGVTQNIAKIIDGILNCSNTRERQKGKKMEF